MRVAVITARGGSKRIPQKNIKMFMGKPMLAWPIMAARKAEIFDRIVVSTDSEEIADVATSLGAEVPFLRPSHLADDHTPTAPVFQHALETLAVAGDDIVQACCIYPTAPFLQSDDLHRGLEALNNGAPAAISVTTFDFPILRAFTLSGEGTLSFHWPEHEMTRSQDLPEFYHDAGQFYWVNVAAFRASGRLLMPGACPVILPRKRVQDLDTLEDWEAAELMAHVLLREAQA